MLPDALWRRPEEIKTISSISHKLLRGNPPNGSGGFLSSIGLSKRRDKIATIPPLAASRLSGYKKR